MTLANLAPRRATATRKRSVHDVTSARVSGDTSGAHFKVVTSFQALGHEWSFVGVLGPELPIRALIGLGI